jgi:hypothetical protein
VAAMLETGESHAVAVAGQALYVASDDGLFEVTLEAPDRGEVTAHVDTGPARDVAVRDGYAFVATTFGLVVVDVSRSPRLAVVAGPLDTGDSRAVVVSGGRAYVASFEGLRVVEVSWPEEPTLLWRVDDPWLVDARDVLVIGSWADWALVLSRPPAGSVEGGLVVVDVTRGQAPEITWRSAVASGSALAVVCPYQLLYIADDDGLSMAGSPPRPVLGGSCPIEGGAASLFLSCFAGGNQFSTVYAVGDGGLRYGTIEGGFFFDGVIDTGSASGVLAVDRHAYVATDRGLSVVALECGED